MTATTIKKYGSLVLSISLFIFLLTQVGCKEDPCAGINCLNGGICAFDRCICPDGYEGDNCSTIVGEECGSIVCVNGGSCVNGVCECLDGWTGVNCGTRVPDPCDEINCLNGGNCVDGTCACPPGFSGEYCEIDGTNADCVGVNCQNGGICVNGSCVCPSGFTGVNCEIQVFNCNDSPCQNGGTCDTITGLCDCPPGYGGADCSDIVDACLVNPIDCQNGGECVDGSCLCPAGWAGDNCEIEAALDIEGTYLGNFNCHLAGEVEQQVVITATMNPNEFELVYSGHLNFTVVDVYDRSVGFEFEFVNGTDEISGGGLISGIIYNAFVGLTDENMIVESCNGLLER